MGGNSMGLVGLETPSATRPGGPTSAANLIPEGDRPGPIGMNTPSPPAEELSAGTVDAQTILNFAQSNEGKKVGSGECFDLADKALQKAGAKSAADYGVVSKDTDYIWGSAVDLASVKPGDIIQLKNYKYVRNEVYDNEKESGNRLSEQTRGSPRHTAIVKSVGSDGKITVWEQNVLSDGTSTGGPVQTFDLYFKSSSTGDAKNGVTITVSGTIKFYRPQPRK